MRVLYSPNASTNGAKLCVTRAPKKVTIEDVSAALRDAPILTPDEEGNVYGSAFHFIHSIANYYKRGGPRKRDKERSDAAKARKPMPPVSGPGSKGRVGASATQHIVQHMFRDTSRDEDVSIWQCFIFIFMYGGVWHRSGFWWKISWPKLGRKRAWAGRSVFPWA